MVHTHTLEWLFRSSEDARHPITQLPKCWLFSYRQVFGWNVWRRNVEWRELCKHELCSNDLEAAVHRLYFKFLSPFGYWFSILLACAYVIEYIFWLSRLFSIKSISIYRIFHTHLFRFFLFFLGESSNWRHCPKTDLKWAFSGSLLYGLCCPNLHLFDVRAHPSTQ